jgi:hypothetical protein
MMFNSIRAGFFYFAAVFGLGFILGTIRVLVLIPRLGELISTLIELPVILSASWIICRQLTTRLQVPYEPLTRLSMGVSAFVLLMGADLALSVWLFGNTVTGHFERYRSLPNAIGLAGQVVFLLFPLLQMENPDQTIQAGDS